jgi:hypothetical protein
MNLLNGRTLVVMMGVGACVMAAGCFSCTETVRQPVPAVVVQPASPPVVVAPAPVVIAPTP